MELTDQGKNDASGNRQKSGYRESREQGITKIAGGYSRPEGKKRRFCHLKEAGTPAWLYRLYQGRQTSWRDRPGDGCGRGFS